MKILKLPPIEKLSKHLSYNPETGLFTWLIGRQGIRAGKQAGKTRFDGYIDIKFESIPYLAHRLAWLLHHKEDPSDKYIDHVNLIRNDNRIDNLRIASAHQNSQNKISPIKCSSGVKGVHWNKNMKKWNVKIMHNGVNNYFGAFSTVEEATQIAIAARNKLHGEFANHETKD